MVGSHRIAARRYLKEWAAAALFLAMAGIGLYLYAAGRVPARHVLRITGGSLGGARALIARRLVIDAAAFGISLKLVESEGSKDALDRVDRGAIDLALVQGGLEESK